MTQLAGGASAAQRFYKTAMAKAAGGGFEVHLDGVCAKTSGRMPLASANQALANEIAAEWNAVDGVIDTQKMPLTKLLATVIDLGEEESANWRRDYLKFLGSDLLCYRAREPAALVDRQQKIWTPFLDQWSAQFGAELTITDGIMAIAQPDDAIDAASGFLDALSTGHLLALKNAAEITGSAVLGCALLQKFATPAEIFAASRLDEHFQEQRWGGDSEAAAREARLKSDFDSIARFLDLLAA